MSDRKCKNCGSGLIPPNYTWCPECDCESSLAAPSGSVQRVVVPSIEELLNKPHGQRTIEERVRICEHAIAQLCRHNANNAPANAAAWRLVPIA